MPNTIQRALPRFPASIVGLGGVTVVISGGVATISIDEDNDPTVSQYNRALSLIIPGGVSTLNSDVSADPDDPNRVILSSTRTVLVGGAYETLVKTTLSLSTAQMTAIMATALVQTP